MSCIGWYGIGGVRPLLTEVIESSTDAESVLEYLKINPSQLNDASASGKTALMYAVEKQYLAVVTKMLSMKVNKNALDANYENVLFYAVRGGSLEILHALVRGHCNIRQINNCEQTLLHIACEKQMIDRSIALVVSGVDYTALDIEGRHAVDYLTDPEAIARVEAAIAYQHRNHGLEDKPVNEPSTAVGSHWASSFLSQR